MGFQEDCKVQMAAQLKEWNAQISLLEARAEKAGAAIAQKRSEDISRLRAIHHSAAEKLKELEDSTGLAWDQAKETADKIWEDLKTGIAAAHSKFK